MKLPVSAFDEKVFLWVNGHGGHWLDYLCGWPTHFGDALALSLTAFAYMLIWDRRPVFRKFYAILIATFAAQAVSGAVKAFVYRPRPYVHFLEQIESGTYHINALFGLLAKESSFPSGHTATVFAGAYLLVRMYGPRLWFLYPWAAFIAFTRLYVGVHFPTDLLAGAALGMLMGAVSERLVFAKKPPAHVPERRRAPGI